MSLRPTPAKFNDCGRRNGARTGTAGLAGAAFGALVSASLLGTLFFLAIARNPTRTRAFLNLPSCAGKLALGRAVLDRSKLPNDLWVRMVWAPKDGSGIQDHPIALVSDRRRWLTGLIPTVLGGLLLTALALVRAPVVLLIVPLLVSVAGARYAAGGQAGYYEVREDGSLGDFLGRKPPLGISEMRRTKA